MQLVEILMYALVALGLFYLLAPHETQIQYLPEVLAKMSHQQHQLLGGVCLVVAAYIYVTLNPDTFKSKTSEIPSELAPAPSTAASSEVLKLSIPRRASIPRRSSVMQPPNGSDTMSTISLPSYSSLSSLPTSEST